MRAETASATKALKASWYQVGFDNGRVFFINFRFDENKQPPLPGIWLRPAGLLLCDQDRLDNKPSPWALLGHHALADARGGHFYATGSCRNAIPVATCMTIKQVAR
jgi:hypothetical protein